MQHVCYLDASKAFDNINHCDLFPKLLARKIPYTIVHICRTLYSFQICVVQWPLNVSSHFHMCNGVPQGDLLCPSLFNVYTDNCSSIFNECQIGCNFNNSTMYHMLYSDNSILLTSSSMALPKPLDICSAYVSEYNIRYYGIM